MPIASSSKVEPGPFDQFTYESPARRSPRKRAQVTYQDHDASAGESDLTDLEDLASPRRSPVKKTTTRTLVKFTRKNAKHIEVKEEDTAMEGGKAKVKAKGPRVAKPKKVPSKLEVLHPAPDGWEEVYGIIKAMRKREIAPVDTMGCQLAGKDEADPKNARLACLISLILSPQTKDEVCSAAVEKLRVALNGAISLEGIITADDEVIRTAIKSVGFWQKKTIYLKESVQMLKDQFEGDVPKNVDDLCKLPGVGPKVAFLTLQNAWDINTGIGVDVHVERITNRLGWHVPPTKGVPEKARMNLESWLPHKYWPDINHQLVGFGQLICLPRKPRCDLCDLSTKGLCPSAMKVTTKHKTTRAVKQIGPSKVEVEVEEEKRTWHGKDLGAVVKG